MQANNRRREPRLVTSLKVGFRHGTRSGSAYTLDLSAGGMFLQMAEPFVQGELIELEFQVSVEASRKGVRCTGRVLRAVRTNQATELGLLPGVALEFAEFLQGRHDLMSFLDGRLASAPSTGSQQVWGVMHPDALAAAAGQPAAEPATPEPAPPVAAPAADAASPESALSLMLRVTARTILLVALLLVLSHLAMRLGLIPWDLVPRSLLQRLQLPT